ncbi:hypothetical protein PVAND_013187 [Polypedilum vanderplanki]|uniref:Uncharacterized protein n=1 Tax=Polypedilum vanderplanki TaxID=319348 RepID=A0A9J6CQR1_POLVA|nr:hypothetical protein PVAND_013187 [Polypedilum vanderplanki]
MEFGIPGNKIFQVASVHFILVSSALMTEKPAAAAYVFYNILFLACLFWAIHCKHSVEALNSAYAINFASFFFDIVVIYFYFADEKINLWSKICVILNAIYRVFSLKEIYEEIVKRNNDELERAELV